MLTDRQTLSRCLRMQLSVVIYAQWNSSLHNKGINLKQTAAARMQINRGKKRGNLGAAIWFVYGAAIQKENKKLGVMFSERESIWMKLAF